MKEDRFRNIRHAEYELLDVLLKDERVRELIHNRLRRGIPRGDTVATGRANRALDNISGIIRGMMANRIKNLPDTHIDSEAES
jgi:hypothetical protein